MTGSALCGWTGTTVSALTIRRGVKSSQRYASSCRNENNIRRSWDVQLQLEISTIHYTDREQIPLRRINRDQPFAERLCAYC